MTDFIYREYLCKNKEEKNKVLNCRGTTTAKIGDPREKLGFCPECYDEYDREQAKLKKWG